MHSPKSSHGPILFAILICCTSQCPVQAQTSSNRTRLMDRVWEPTFDQSAERASQQALREPLAENQRPSSQRHEMVVSVRNTNDLIVELRKAAKRFLVEYKDKYPDVYEENGIQHVKPKHLDLRLLKFIRLRSTQKDVMNFSIVYDAAFHRQVRKRGRQFKLKRSGRFESTLYVFAGIFAALFFLYGTLKVLRARYSKHDDYISAGQISMV